MSNSLAVATVSSALQKLLQPEVEKEIFNAKVNVSYPKKVEVAANPAVNIFLYQVTPNIAFRNCNLPYRNSEGEMRRKPQVALDLHYLLSFVGDETKLEPQRLLGRVVSTLEEKPILTKTLLNNTLKNPLLTFLKASDLAQQKEQIKLIPEALSLEELSKLWSVFFQIPYTLSLSYQASVVLIESTTVPVTAQPVQERKLNALVFTLPPTVKAAAISMTNFKRSYNKIISATIAITKAEDESQITDYVLYWSKDGKTKLANTEKIKQIYKTGEDLSYQLPSGTNVPGNANYIVVLTKNTAGEMLEGVGVTVPVPLFARAAAITNNLKIIGNKVSGSITITKALDEKDVKQYVLYWSQNGINKLAAVPAIATLVKTGQNLTHNIPADTPLPLNAKYVLVLVNTTKGEMVTGISTKLTLPRVPDVLAGGINNSLVIKDNKITSGSVTVIKAIDESNLTSYVLYWSQDGRTRLSGTSAITTLEKGSSLTYTPSRGTSLPANAKYILVFTKNVQGEMTTGLSTALSTGDQSNLKSYTDRNNLSYTDRSNNQYQGR